VLKIYSPGRREQQAGEIQGKEGRRSSSFRPDRNCYLRRSTSNWEA